MQILITTSVARAPRIWQFTPWTLALACVALILPLMMLSLMLYHAILLKAAHEHWPIISDVVRFVERQEFAQRDRYMRENLDAMAIKVGELQAKLVRMEAVSERLAGMAGIKPEELKQMDVPTGGAGGALPALRQVPEVSSVEELRKITNSLDAVGDRNADLLTLIESHLFEKRLEALMIPSTPPVNGPVGSGFGFRSDPFTGRAALHTGLDFPSGVGTPIMAAAGGVVITASYHPQYGQMVEIDHGNGLVTRYGHTSRMLVKQGDLVKRGQLIANVGSTGRSTGPHLHFEVLVEGVQQDPARFLAGKAQGAGQPVALGAPGAGH
jgi:murein DD-endopeptidase MepM/ murein hydrolase activator NlpD